MYQNEVNHGAVVSPGPKLHGAVLPVKWEKRDVHGARTFITGRRGPDDSSIGFHYDFGHEGAFETSVSTVVKAVVFNSKLNTGGFFFVFFFLV